MKNKLVQGPWKSLEEIAAGREHKERCRKEMLDSQLSAQQDAYRSYRKKMATDVFLSLYGALGLTDILADMSSAIYLIALPSGVAFTWYLTKERRTQLREFKAYTQALKRAKEQ